MTGRLRLAGRLAVRDLRHRPAAGLLVLVALLAASTTMTLALVVRSAAEAPWDQTFTATRGPHAVATAYDADAATGRVMADLAAAAGVVAHAGPYPLLSMPDGALEARGRRIGVEVMARDPAPAAVDQPVLTSGGWLRDGGVVVEESFAAALRVRVGDRLTIAGEPFDVVGIGVSAFRQPTPFYSHGLVWATRADAGRLAPAAESRGEVLMLRLAGAATLPTADTGEVIVDSWRATRLDALTDVLFAQFGLIVGAVSLSLLAAASVAVAMAGRMAAQTRRAALLKAVGGTPRFIAAVTLAEHLVFGFVAGAAGLAAGCLLAPALAGPVPGVLGAAAPATPSAATVALVLGIAVVLVVLPSVLPAVRAARASTVRALANPVRPPRRLRFAIRFSARLPVPLLLGSGSPPAVRAGRCWPARPCR